MSRSRTVFKNSFILASQQIIVNLITIFVVGYTARTLGLEDYGVFSLAFTFPIIFLSLGHLGLRTLTIREISSNRENSADYLSKILPPRLILVVNMGVAIILAALILGYTEKIIYAIAIAILSYMLDSMSRIALDIFQAHEEMGQIAIRDIIVRIVTGILTIVALYFGCGLFTVCWIYTAGSFIGLIINIVLFMRRFDWPGIKWDYTFIVDNLKEGIPFTLAGFASVLLIRADIIMISKLLGSESVGIYNAAANLFYRLNFVCDAIATATFPAISQLFWIDREEATAVFGNSMQYIIILSVPMAVGGILLSDSIINLIYGPKFIQTIPIFCILATGIPMMFFTVHFNYTLGAIKEQRYVLVVLSLLAILNIVLNFFFLSVYGEIGAAIATLTSQTLAMVCFGYKIGKNFKFSIKPRIYIAMFTSLALMIASINQTKFLGLFPCILISSVIYLGSFGMVTGPKRNFEKLRSILSNYFR